MTFFWANMVWSSVIMLVILAVRRPVAARLGAGAAYALWLLPALRLLMPPLPHMPGLVPAISPAQLPEQLFTLPIGVAQPLAAKAERLDLLSWLVALWIAGAALFILWQVARHHAFVARLTSGSRTRGSYRGLALIESAAVAGPVALGLVRRRILLPHDFDRRYTEEEQRLALEHEAVHHHRGDIWWNHVALALLALNWFNPIAWISFRAFRADQELACDARVTASAAPALREAYARALVKSASRAGHAAPLIPALNHADQLKRRLRMMTSHRHSPGRRVGGAATLIALAGLMVALTPVAAAPDVRAIVPRIHNVVAAIAAPPAMVAQAPSVPAVARAPLVSPAVPVSHKPAEEPLPIIPPRSPPPLFRASAAAHMAGDHAEAVRLLAMAAEEGDPMSTSFLGTYYATGMGVAKDQAKAVMLWRQAADAGFPKAMFNLALAYEAGNGVERDRSQAAVWFRRWAGTGDDPGAAAILAQYDVSP